MSAIGPGDWVVCVDLHGPSPNGFLAIGRTYLVKSVEETEPCLCCSDTTGFDLLGDPDESPNFMFCANLFRPFHGKEESSLGLSRKLPTCEPVS